VLINPPTVSITVNLPQSIDCWIWFRLRDGIRVLADRLRLDWEKPAASLCSFSRVQLLIHFYFARRTRGAGEFTLLFRTEDKGLLLENTFLFRWFTLSPIWTIALSHLLIEQHWNW
jgi:hypothetical protein